MHWVFVWRWIGVLTPLATFKAMDSRVLLLLCAELWAGLIVIPRSVTAAANVEGKCTSVTPSNFRQTFISNCRNLGQSEDKCNTAYTLFLEGFSNRNAADIRRENYNPYFNHLPIMAMADQSLFWSKTINLVKLLSMMNMMGVNIISSENAVSGKILDNFMDSDNLCWCSAAGNTGLVLNNSCTRAARSLFWAQFSVRFAQAASGTVFYLTDGNMRPAYSPSSFFGCYELMNLNTAVVKRLVVLNVHTAQGEACGTESLKVLQQSASSLNLAYTCHDIIGSASEEAQLDSIAASLKKIIGDVQNGAKLLDVSVFLIFLSFALTFL